RHRCTACALLILPAWTGAVAAAEGGGARPAPPPGIDDINAVDSFGYADSALRRRQDLKTTPQAVEVLTSDDLVNTPALGLPDRLRYVPGVDVYELLAGQYEIGIHGYNGINNNRVLVLYDGSDFSLAEFGSVPWIGTYNQSDLARVEVLKGPSSVTYGANAFGGVISLSGRQPGDRQQVFSSASYGSNALVDADATALGPLGEDLYYKVGIGGSHRGDIPGTVGETPYQASARTSETGHTDLGSLRWNALVGVRLPAENRIEVDYHGLDLYTWEFLHDLDIGSDNAQVRSHDLVVRLAGPWGEVSQRHVQSSNLDSNQKAVYIPAEDFKYAQVGFRDQTDETRALLHLPLGAHWLAVGGEWRSWRSRSNLWDAAGVFADQGTWAVAKMRNLAFFGEDQWTIDPHWTATAGLRLDDNSQAGANWSPRLGLNWTPDRDQFWRLSYSRGYRLPTPIEAFLRQYYFQSDQHLDAESIQEVDLGWQGRFDQTTRLGFDLFYSRSNDEIRTVPLPSAVMAANFNPTAPGPFFSFSNVDNPVHVLGLELSGEQAVAGTPLTVFANGTWQLARHEHDVVYQSDGFASPVGTLFRFDRNLGRTADAPPMWKANLGGRYEKDHWFASLAGRYVGAHEVFSFANSYFDLGSPIELQTLPAYVACDLSVGWSFAPNDRYGRFVRLNVFDLFDSGHYEWFRSKEATLLDTHEHQSTSEIGRVVSVQVGWLF
ncbi:MAG: TonB-dependent receptor, partial [Planctomycetes bacterium]|nr:TonB-dependent receptor [Planctomycetota bacterium]